MNQLGKNLVLMICVVGALLAVLGIKRKFGSNEKQALLSQPSDQVEVTLPSSKKSTTKPRVLQSRPVVGNEPTVLSPARSTYVDQSRQNQRPSQATLNRMPISPIAAGVSDAVEAVEPPQLVPVSETTESQLNADISDESAQEIDAVQTAKVPVAPRPLPDFVLTGPEDSFWSISEQIYGSGAYYRALFRHNESKVLRPDQLRAGVKVRTPSLDVLQKLYPGDFPSSELEPSLP